MTEGVEAKVMEVVKGVEAKDLRKGGLSVISGSLVL